MQFSLRPSRFKKGEKKKIRRINSGTCVGLGRLVVNQVNNIVVKDIATKCKKKI